MEPDELIDRILGLGPEIRYVAVGRGQEVLMRERQGLAEASAAGSDRYEELLVNPTLITLARQRGEIDCGGLRYVVVAYGHFFQVVMPHDGGHVSVAVEPTADPVEVASRIAGMLDGPSRPHSSGPGRTRV